LTRLTPPTKALTKQVAAKREIHLTVESDADAVSLLAVASDLTKTAVKQAMQQGAVWWQQGKQVRRLRRASRTVTTGDQLHFYYDPTILAAYADDATLLADEGSYSVWNKPAGMLSQGSKWGDHCTLTRFAEQHLTPQRTAYLVHRLDRAASGVMVIAHSKASARELSRQFHDREVTKIYRAQVIGQLPDTGKALILTGDIDNRSARSEVKWLGYDPQTDRTLIEIVITTGRKHQIRRHLAEAGWPIVGDRLYALSQSGSTGSSANAEEPLQLTSWRLTLLDPLTNQTRQYQLTDDLLG